MGAIVDGIFSWLGMKEQTKAAEKGMEASERNTDKTLGFLRESRDQTRADNAPWLEAGKGALGRLNAWSTDPNSFTADPGYQWRAQQGIDQIDRSAASRGRIMSGGTLKALDRYNQGFASNEFGSAWNRQAGLAGVGQTAAASNQSAGQNFANGAGTALNNDTARRVSGYTQIGDARAGFWGGVNSSINDTAMNAFKMMGGF